MPNPTTPPDTSPEAVERLALTLTDPGPIHVRARLQHDPAGASLWHCGPVGWAQDAAATLRALLAERDALRSEMDEYLAGNRLFVQWNEAQAALLQAVAERDAAYRRGWQAGRDACEAVTRQVEIPEPCSVPEAHGRMASALAIREAIRALTPPEGGA